MLCPVREPEWVPEWVPEWAPGRVISGSGVAGRERSRWEAACTYTALSEEGRAFAEARTTQAYAAFIREWEDRLNGWLRRRKVRAG